MGHKIQHLVPTYTIYKDGSYYYAMDSNGDDTTVVPNTNLATVINAADNALDTNGGWIFLNLLGSHGIGTTLSLGKRTKLSGLGPNTILTVTNNINCIEIDSSTTSASWAIEDLQIKMGSRNGTRYSGHGIYSGRASSVSAWHYNMAYIRNVWISYVKAGYAGIYLLDIYMMHFEQVLILTYGTGIYIGHSGLDGMNWGNSLFTRVMIDLKEDNCVGLDVVQGDSNRAMTLTTFNHLQVFQSGLKTGSVGVRMSGGVEQRYTTFTQLIVENCGIGLYLNNCRNVCLINPQILSADTYCVQLEGLTYGFNVKGGRLGGNYWDNTIAKRTGTADSGTTTTTVDTERTEANDYWNNGYIKFTSGNNIGQTRRVTNFDNNTDTMTHEAFGTAVQTGDTYWIKKTDIEKNIIDSAFLIANVANGQFNWTEFKNVKYNLGGKYVKDDFHYQTGAWADPSANEPVWDGRRILIYNYTQGEYRIYMYVDDEWKYVGVS